MIVGFGAKGWDWWEKRRQLWQRKDSRKNPCGDAIMLCHHSLNISILVVNLCYHFARCYHWEKLDRRYMASVSNFFFFYNCL